MQVITANGEETEGLAARIGSKCQGGEIFELRGDLGAGKTAFVKGLARGIGITDSVTSPSFTINNVYQGATRTLQHFDFYRLTDPGVLAEEFKEAVFDPMNVIAIEWGNVIESILPKTHVSVSIATLPDDRRSISITAPRTLAYVLEGLA